MSLTLSPQLSELAQRIRDGEVVFFVGAGFSIDSEQMSAGEVVRRLVTRLFALAALADAGTRDRVLERFAGTFNVSSRLEDLRFDRRRFESEWKEARVGAPPDGLEARLGRLASDWHAVNCLAQRYYEVNEWMCRAYGFLLASLTIGSYADFARDLAAREEEIRRQSGWTWLRFDAMPEWLWKGVRDWKTGEGLPGPAHWWANLRLQQFGKLALMATFGFLDPLTVAGCPFDEDPAPEPLSPDGHGMGRRIESCYLGRLRTRHHVLARLAREGFCPSLLTTNFDLLLEGAMRLSGFEREGAACVPLSLPVPHFDVIASPVEFYRRGKAFRTAALVKIHGCAGRVRRLGADLEAQLQYLPQVVYTYREIQHWRADHWTADFLKTLLRTRTLVFAGYSTADPVIHDTFRSVYEEMEQRSASAPADDAPATLPPAYFLGFTGSRQNLEFHADEVLLSATRSVGGTLPDDRGHPHYLRFSGLTDDDSSLPRLDELLGWVAHEIFRSQQAEALEGELAALIGRLDRRRPASETAEVIQRFNGLRARERRWIEGASKAAEGRRRLARVLSWSAEFHVALRREWARALILGQLHSGGAATGPSRTGAVARLDHPLWYFPASERPAWTAWSAVVELALCRIGEVLCGQVEGEAVEPTRALRPTVFFRLGGRQSSPRLALTLQLRGFDRPGKRPEVPGMPARRVVWLFSEESLPWTCRGPERPDQPDRPGRGLPLGNDRWFLQPTASQVWQWARNAGSARSGGAGGRAWSDDTSTVCQALGLPNVPT